jgi:AsnC-like helix-turn-helix protein
VAVKGYILIQAEQGTHARLAEEVAGVPGVRWVERVTGPYDLIAGVMSGADGVPALVPRIQELRGVIRALTSLVIDGVDAERPGMVEQRGVAAAGW